MPSTSCLLHFAIADPLQQHINAFIPIPKSKHVSIEKAMRGSTCAALPFRAPILRSSSSHTTWAGGRLLPATGSALLPLRTSGMQCKGSQITSPSRLWHLFGELPLTLEAVLPRLATSYSRCDLPLWAAYIQICQAESSVGFSERTNSNTKARA